MNDCDNVFISVIDQEVLKFSNECLIKDLFNDLVAITKGDIKTSKNIFLYLEHSSENSLEEICKIMNKLFDLYNKTDETSFDWDINLNLSYNKVIYKLYITK